MLAIPPICEVVNQSSPAICVLSSPCRSCILNIPSLPRIGFNDLSGHSFTKQNLYHTHPSSPSRPPFIYNQRLTSSWLGMDGGEFDYQRRTGSVKAAVNMYGGSPSVKKSHTDIPERSSSRARELHMAKRDISRYKESRRAAESVKAQAESELSTAKKMVKDLAFRIEETNYQANSRMRYVERLEKSSGIEENVLAERSKESHRYAEVMRELESVKQELSKLKLDMASVLEEKSRAEKEIEASSLKVWSNSNSVEGLRKEIEEVNEEQVLVELARIEALKEYGEIEAEREKEANEFSSSMEVAKKKVKDLTEEIDHCTELENKLAVTLYDVNFLQNELKSIKDKDKLVQGNDSLKVTRSIYRKGEELEGSLLLPSESIKEELEAAKKELAAIKEEGFRFMSSMDVIRNELSHVREETARLKRGEEKTELTVQNLNSKLLRAKAKLEAVSAAEEKANGIASNLALTLEQLKTEEAAEKEKELFTEENAKIKEEIQKTEAEIYSAEEKIETSIQELNAVKSSEALAFDNLRSLIEKTMQARASASQNSSSITISKFEYEYLTGRAVGAEELADKKVAAAQAWIEALKASEKEILMKIEMAHREIRDTRVEEEKEVFKTERTYSTKRKVEGELRNWRQNAERTAEPENLQPGLARKSRRGNYNLTPSRRAKSLISASPATGITRTTSFTIKKKTKVIPNFTKLFSGKKID